MGQGTGLEMRLESIRSGLNLARDGLLLIVLLMLLVFPSAVNGILSRAGFTSASILGFDWQKQLEASTQETEAAKKDVQTLNEELATRVTQLEQFAASTTNPTAKLQVDRLARQLRASQTSAAQIGDRLGKNLEIQRDIVRRLPRY